MSAPTRDETTRLLMSVCADVLVVDERELTEDARLDSDLELDSLDLLEILAALGEHGIGVDHEELGAVRTIGAFIDLVHARAVSGAAAPAAH